MKTYLIETEDSGAYRGYTQSWIAAYFYACMIGWYMVFTRHPSRYERVVIWTVVL